MVDSAIRALAKVGLVDRPLHDVLQEIIDIANGAVPGAEATSITLLRGEEAFTAAYTGQMALDADELQYAKGYGPCMDAGRSGLVLIVDDTAQEGRWPDYAREVNHHGVGSSLSIPLPYQAATIGAVDLYASRPRSFGPESVEAGEEIATYIAVAVANADAHAEA